MSKIKRILQKTKTSTKRSLKCATLMKKQVLTENKTQNDIMKLLNTAN